MTKEKLVDLSSFGYAKPQPRNPEADPLPENPAQEPLGVGEPEPVHKGTVTAKEPTGAASGKGYSKPKAKSNKAKK